MLSRTFAFCKAGIKHLEHTSLNTALTGNKSLPLKKKTGELARQMDPRDCTTIVYVLYCVEGFIRACLFPCSTDYYLLQLLISNAGSLQRNVAVLQVMDDCCLCNISSLLLS